MLSVSPGPDGTWAVWNQCLGMIHRKHKAPEFTTRVMAYDVRLMG